MRNILIAILFLLWLILGWIFYTDSNKCCSDDLQSTSTLQNNDRGPLLFSWGNEKPKIGDDWLKTKDSLISSLGENKILEIMGLYHEDSLLIETESIGMKRALEARKLFGELKDDRITIITKQVPYDSSDLNRLFNSVGFASRIITENIKEIDDKTLIYFPSNSTNKLNSKEVEAYLDDVVERIKKSGESVILTGHTDDTGTEETNLDLAQKRANIVKQYLVQKGAEQNLIKALSKGESAPIADNSSEEGKSKNRRTELQIIK